MARGDHISVKRCKGMYTHHGIDMGDGTVVHFSGEPLRIRHACVVRDSWEVFCGGDTPRVVSKGDAHGNADDVAEIALSHLGQTGYQLWSNNCEHFANHCNAGKKHSRQARRVLRGLAVAGTAVAAGGIALVVATQLHRGARPTS